MMKKMSLFIMSLLMIGTLVGCQNKSSDSNKTETKQPEAGKKIEKSSNDVSIQVQG